MPETGSKSQAYPFGLGQRSVFGKLPIEDCRHWEHHHCSMVAAILCCEIMYRHETQHAPARVRPSACTYCARYQYIPMSTQIPGRVNSSEKHRHPLTRSGRRPLGMFNVIILAVFSPNEA